MALQPSKKLRLRRKTPPPAPVQVPLCGPLPDFASYEDDQARKTVYLITFPHPVTAFSQCGVRLVAPESLSKQQLLECVLHSCAMPDYVDLRSQMSGARVTLRRAGVFYEPHKENEEGEVHSHGHVAVQGDQFRFLPVKRALLRRWGLASHWSCRHEGYWSALRYCVVPSPDKPDASLDKKPVLWSLHGAHPPLSVSIHEPLTASALAARRDAMERRAAEDDTQAPKITELDIYAIVVLHKFRNTDNRPFAHLDLIAHAKKHCSTAVQTYLFKHRARLSALLNDV